MYAYIRSQRPPPDAFSPLYVPVLSIPANDVGLRPEFAALFRHTNISASHLITLDDLPSSSELKQGLPPEITQWILVDHNRIEGALGVIYASRVHGTIDHHEEEGSVPQDTLPEPRVISKCGSCTSLVVSYLRPTWDVLSSSSLSSGGGYAQGDSLVDDTAVSQEWDAQVAKLALASILIDTRNLQDEGKTKDVDREAVSYLEAKIRLSWRDSRTWNRAEFYEEIDQAKRALDGLSLPDILRKDYKEWTERNLKLGISSVVKPLDYLIQKVEMKNSESAFDQVVDEFMNSRDLKLFAIMTTSNAPTGQFQRQLLLQARPGSHKVAQRFEQDAKSDLDLESVPDLGIKVRDRSDSVRRVWRQWNLGMSRKQVAPLLRKAMRSATE